MQWLRRSHPELVPRYTDMYRASAYAPAEYRTWLSAKIAPLMAKHKILSTRLDPTTGTMLSSARRFGPGSPTGAGKAGAPDDSSHPGAMLQPLTLF